MIASVCYCGEENCLHFAADYPWCRPCADHHRPPECAIDQQGHALAQCGCRLENVEANDHRPTCCYYEVS